MWLCVDRTEGDTVILQDDGETLHRLCSADYTAMTGRAPAEGDILQAEISEGRIIRAAYDEAETASRKQAARGRLNRLFGCK